MQTLFEAIPEAELRCDGKQRYLTSLEKRCHGDLTEFNSRHGLTVKSFSELDPSEY